MMGVEALDLVRDNAWASQQNHAAWAKDDGPSVGMRKTGY
jgi:hypothetical protein